MLLLCVYYVHELHVYSYSCANQQTHIQNTIYWWQTLTLTLNNSCHISQTVARGCPFCLHASQTKRHKLVQQTAKDLKRGLKSS